MFRIDGDLHPVQAYAALSEAEIEDIAEAMLTPALKDTFMSRHQVDFSFSWKDVTRFRGNIFRQRGSISIVVRYILDQIPRLDALGLPPVLSDVIMEKRGLVLVVGSTGSGKSTTIASMLDHRNENFSGHILTIEDPIEYLFRHKASIVNQREIGTDTLDWNHALSNAMRQAPDCILIGEIRDRETMSAAIAYAQSGHLCLATLHANNSYQALNRVLSFYPVEVRPTMLGDLAGRHRGLANMTARADDLGGTLRIRRSRMGGIRIAVELPAEPARPARSQEARR